MFGFRTYFRSFAGTAQSRKSVLLQVLSVCGNLSTCFSTYHTAGRRETIVSTCSPLPNRFMIKVSTQYTVNLVGILVACLGRSPIKLLSPEPLISAVRFVYQGLLFDTMPICASCDKVKYISQIQFHKNRHSLLPLVQLSYHTKFVRGQ